MIDVPLAYAFTAGLVATVNPCGFPMLAAYLSYFVGTDDAERDGAGRVPRALVAAAAVSAGFLAVFAAVGVPINAGVSWIYRVMPWFTLVVGAGLAVLGVAMLTGRKPALSLPRLDRGGETRRLRSMVVFGASYAVASVSCTLPVFLVVVAGTTERVNAASGLLAFGAYGVGMSLVLMVLSLALALARESMVRRLRQALRYADRAAGVLLVVVGAYLLYYGVYAMDPANPATVSPVGLVDAWSSAAAAWLAEGGTSLGLALAAVVAASAGGAVLRRRRRPPVATGEPVAR
ncbi:MAG TPA: cytochrome c biogenesis CcdA family protein [Acidimicrobiales bacterium]|nr:cytochrome c biogenesis CcdA family protein [Acidimicrobiales bacterium]